jgi:hypothetical protein
MLGPERPSLELSAGRKLVVQAGMGLEVVRDQRNTLGRQIGRGRHEASTICAQNPGTYCAVELKIPRRTPSLIVPARAIVFDRDGLHVLVIENGVVHSRKITEIRDLGTEVEVSDGVKQGDEVVLSPPADLDDGSKVRVRAISTAKTAS